VFVAPADALPRGRAWARHRWGNYQYRSSGTGATSYTFTWIGTFTGLVCYQTSAYSHVCVCVPCDNNRARQAKARGQARLAARLFVAAVGGLVCCPVLFCADGNNDATQHHHHRHRLHHHHYHGDDDDDDGGGGDDDDDDR
jgi:hypothetical protein